MRQVLPPLSNRHDVALQVCKLGAATGVAYVPRPGWNLPERVHERSGIDEGALSTEWHLVRRLEQQMKMDVNTASLESLYAAASVSPQDTQCCAVRFVRTVMQLWMGRQPSSPQPDAGADGQSKPAAYAVANAIPLFKWTVKIDGIADGTIACPTS